MPLLELAVGLKIYYLDEHTTGQPAVLLLHGLGASSSSWLLQIPALASAGYRVIAPDARGFGSSSFPKGSATIAANAQDLRKLLQAINLNQVHVVGISMGGAHALQFALDFPAQTAKLVLVNTFARLRPEKMDAWIYFAARFLLIYTLGLKAQAPIVANRIFPKPEQEEFRNAFMQQILQADPRGYRAAMRALWRFNVEKRLGEIQSQTLVISGADDSTVSQRLQRYLVGHIPGAQQIVIPDAGHAVTIDQPAVFNQVLLEFLRS